MPSRLILTLLRVVLPAWVGAAVLFAINGSAEQRHTFEVGEALNGVVRDELAIIRFPAYYSFGFVCVGTSLALTVILQFSPPLPRGRIAWAGGLLLAAIALMLWDHYFVYTPMFGMLDPLGVEKSSEWKRLHATSMITNLIHVSLCLTASLVLSWPIQAGRNAAALDVSNR